MLILLTLGIVVIFGQSVNIVPMMGVALSPDALMALGVIGQLKIIA